MIKENLKLARRSIHHPCFHNIEWLSKYSGNGSLYIIEVHKSDSYIHP